MKKQLNYPKMLEEINELVESDFCMDMEMKQIERAKEYTQIEAKEMAHLLARVYSISHCLHCTACQTKYLLPSQETPKEKEQPDFHKDGCKNRPETDGDGHYLKPECEYLQSKPELNVEAVGRALYRLGIEVAHSKDVDETKELIEKREILLDKLANLR